MNDLVIYGAGGFGREVALLVEQINQDEKAWNFIGFVDDGAIVGGSLPVIGKGTLLENFSTKISVIIAIAYPEVRSAIANRLTNPKIDFPTLIHPGAFTGARDNVIGKGSIITQGVILTTGLSIGKFVIVNLATTIGHDCVIGDYCSIMPGTNISGNVKIGSHSLIGTGSSIIQNISIGHHSIVGAGAVVIRDVPENTTVVGVPARKI